MRTPKERGRFGQRLVEERTARGWTQKEMLAYLESNDIRLAPSVYAAYESGAHRPQAARRELIEALLTKTESPPADATPAGGLSELTVAIAAQTAAINRLVTLVAMQLPEQQRSSLPPDFLHDLARASEAVEASVRSVEPDESAAAPGRLRGGAGTPSLIGRTAS